MVLGLTGKCCAGKDEAGRILEEFGWNTIDVDALGHRALNNRREEVVRRFGEVVRDEQGKIDRKRLGEIVFSDSKALSDLESIVHPEMREMVRRMLAENTNKTVINAALLFPMELHGFCDAVIRVEAPFILRLVRAKRRDGHSIRKILKRFAGQRELFPKFLVRGVDTYSVRNSGSRELLRRRIEHVLKKIGKTNIR